METTNYKKPLGTGFIILFAVFLTNILFQFIRPLFDGLWTVYSYWIILSYIIQAGCVIFIAFNRRCESSVLSKIGSILYAFLLLIYLISQISFNLSGEELLYFPGISEYVYPLALYVPSLLLLAWGCRLWLPVKIVFSATVFLDLVSDMIWATLSSIYRSCDYFERSIEYLLQCALTFLTMIIFFTTVTSLILTIIWLSKMSKINADK